MTFQVTNDALSIESSYSINGMDSSSFFNE